MIHPRHTKYVAMTFVGRSISFLNFSEIGDEVASLQQLSTEAIVEGVARCLRVITQNDNISYKLPPSMSARFRIGSSLANELQVCER